MNETVRLGSLAGVRIGVNWTVLVIFTLIAVVLATAQFPQQFPDLAGGVYAAAGLVAAILFFASLLAHELAHAIVARRNGVDVDGITLWLFGGVARLSGDAPDPGADMRISGVGPLVSLLLVGVFWVLTSVLVILDAPGIAVAVFGWLAAINLLLTVFNLAPAAPLDGGRLLRSLVWRRTGDRLRATEVASRAGQVFGFLLVALGLLGFVFLPGIGGLWLALIGGFIMAAAGAEAQHARAQGSLEGVTAGDLMTPSPLTVDGSLSVSNFVEGYVFQTPHSAFPTLDQRGRLSGLITLNRVKQVPPAERGHMPVSEVACPIDEVPVVSADELATDLLTRMTGCPDGRALVVEDGRLLGMVSSRDVMGHLERMELREPQSAGSR